jgi:hypothetical protein
MEDGKNGIIYYIELDDEYYIGSTKQKLCKRQAKHNEDYRKEKCKSKLYERARELGIEKINCVWIEDIIFNSIEELRAREEYWRKKYKDEKNSNLNSQVCFQTLEEKKEYDNNYNQLQETKDRKKKHYEDNKERRKAIPKTEERKKWEKEYEQKPEVKQMRREKAMERYNEKKDEINEKNRLSYQKNKEARRAKQNEKKECPHCKKLMNGSNLKRHITTQHKDIIP